MTVLTENEDTSWPWTRETVRPSLTSRARDGLNSSLYAFDDARVIVGRQIGYDGPGPLLEIPLGGNERRRRVTRST